MKTTVKKSNSHARGGRVKANTIKAGVTRNRQRRYSCGGKLKK
jgi:hypothetical protein